MSKNDMLGPLTRALVGVPAKMLGLLLDIANRLGSVDGENFFNDLAKFVREWKKQMVEKFLSIVHNRFNPKKFLGDGWSILNQETDARSIALTELDLSKVELVTMLKDGETYIQGEEKLKRLKLSDYIRLDADIFLALWENQHLIPESWKGKVNGNIRYIFFDGTLLQHPDGVRYVLCLYWSGGEWDWDCHWLDDGWRVSSPSAVLAS